MTKIYPHLRSQLNTDSGKAITNMQNNSVLKCAVMFCVAAHSRHRLRGAIRIRACGK